MGKLNIQDAGFNIGVNFIITKRDKETGAILQQEKSHNRCLGTQLLGIAKFLNGDYNHTAPYMEQDYYNWIPRYLGVGTNVAASGNLPVGTTVKITDTRLLNEISPRMLLPERNEIISRAGQEYIQLVIDAYLPENYYNNQTIAEAGLFSQETGNNCLFRIVFPGVEKTPNSVVEISWTISIISVASSGDPTVVVDKTDLETAFQTAMTKIKGLYPACSDLCDALWDSSNNCGIYIYGDNATTQETVNNITSTINTLANNLH